jgi:hypothetical protein
MTDTGGSADTPEKRALELFEKSGRGSGAKATEQINVAGGILVRLKYKRDEKDKYAWYFEKGRIRRLLDRTMQVALAIEGELGQKSFLEFVMASPFPEIIKLIVVSLLTITLLIAIIYIATHPPENKSFPLLTGLFGFLCSYFVGRKPQ